jgi:hypothetical protein
MRQALQAEVQSSTVESAAEPAAMAITAVAKYGGAHQLTQLFRALVRWVL